MSSFLKSKEVQINKIRKFLLGNQESSGLLSKIFLYILLCGVGFVFLYPLLQIFATSLKDAYDLVNPLVVWIPTKLYFNNYSLAWGALKGFEAIWNSIWIMLVVAICQTISSAIIAYGIAKFPFWLTKLCFGLALVTFVMPAQVTFLPRYVQFNTLKLLPSIWPFVLPSALGQGLKAALFILIFYQFFKMTPKSLDEAASIDGAGSFKTFAVINMKMATPAIVVVFIFSFVWNWNETYLADSYFGDAIITLPLALERFRTFYEQMFPATSSANAMNPMTRYNQGLEMAGTMISVVPLIVLYAIVERKLIESIDRSGITGE